MASDRGGQQQTELNCSVIHADIMKHRENCGPKSSPRDVVGTRTNAQTTTRQGQGKDSNSESLPSASLSHRLFLLVFVALRLHSYLQHILKFGKSPQNISKPEGAANISDLYLDAPKKRQARDPKLEVTVRNEKRLKHNFDLSSGNFACAVSFRNHYSHPATQ